MSSPTHITSAAQLRTILSGNDVVVIDFYADWCGPCKAIAPTYEQMSKTHSKPGKAAFVKVNTDELQDVARKYEITAMPTFLVLRDSREVARVRGADPRALRDAVEKAVKGPGGAAAGGGAAFATKGHTLGPAPGAGGGGVGWARMPSMRGWTGWIVGFLGLYFVSLFALDAYGAAEASSFNVNNKGGRPARPEGRL